MNFIKKQADPTNTIHFKRFVIKKGLQKDF